MARDRNEFEGLPRAQVLNVLRLHGVDVAVIGAMTYLSKGELHRAYELDDRIYRRMLHTLARLFEVPIHHFFHPGMIPKE